jgi:hypothetical protein
VTHVSKRRGPTVEQDGVLASHHGPTQKGPDLVLYGTSLGGLVAAGSQLVGQDTSGVPGEVGGYHYFGWSLAAGDLDGEGRKDLAVGACTDDIPGVTAAGSVTVLYGATGGLQTVGSERWSQDSPNVPGTAELGDSFGWALAAGDFRNDRADDLAIGVPYDLVAFELAGSVNVLNGFGPFIFGDGFESGDTTAW